MGKSFLSSCAIILLAMSLAGCSDCQSEADCEYGQCDGRRCVCDEGYVGNTCNLQANPEAIIVNEVSIRKLPEELMQQVWDNDTSHATAYLPDVLLQVRRSNESEIAFTSRERFMNTRETSFQFRDDMDIRLENEFPKLVFTIADLDLPAPEPVYDISATGYYNGASGFPDSVRYEDENGVLLVLKLRYEHQ